MHERTWQFRLDDEKVVDCGSYFEKRAREVAEAMNCQVVASTVVSVENLSGHGRKIVGHALLDNASMSASAPKARKGGRVPKVRLGGHR